MRIQSVLGEITPEQLGLTYMHEHLIIDSEIVEKDFPHIYLPSVSEAVAEVELCQGANVAAMVDCMPLGSGRQIRKLAQISSETGMHIIASTGLHHARYYESHSPLENSTAEQLAAIFVEEITSGAEGTHHKTGIIKTVSSGPEINKREQRLFEAAAIAHHLTGAPILTHCEHGTGAVEQIALLQSLNVNLKSVTLSHTDKVADVGYHREILSSGIFVEYDQSLRQLDQTMPESAKLTAAMVEAGFVDQIMVGTDGARRTLWSSLGGKPGLAALSSQWRELLIRCELSAHDIEKIFIHNPAKALAFSTKM